MGCNNVIPHAKWHAQTAAALSDMTRLMDFVLELENRHPAPDTKDTSSRKVVKNQQHLATIEGYFNMIMPTIHKIMDSLPDVKKVDERTRTCCADGPGC